MAEAIDIKDKKEKNWVRVAYGFKFLKNGLAGFIDKQIHKQHEDLIRCLETDLNLPAKSCSSCSSENLLPYHKDDQCIQKFRSKCFCSTRHNRRKCPNQFCSRFYDKVVFAHAEANPIWQNTDPTRWYSDHWELAKCYLGTTGYLTIHSASETDVTGLLSIAINDLFVVIKIDNLDNFKQAREIRNQIFHRKMFEITDDEVALYIDRMIDVLQDKLHLLHDEDSRQAVDQLNKLKKNEINISTEDADELRKNAFTAISMIREVTEESKFEIEEAKRLTLRDIELKGAQMVEALFGFWDILTFKKLRLRSELKEELVRLYNEKESMIPASPLVENHVVRLTELYVQPPISAFIKPIAYKQKKRISSYREMFLNDYKVPYKNIYIEADAGYGKTSFTQKVAITWCQAHRQDKVMHAKFNQDDVDTLKRFDYLFLLHLRDFQGDACTLAELIVEFLSQNLHNKEQFSEQFIAELLKTKTCLVIIDGLDEWVHPETCKRTPEIPHNIYGGNCTVLTTTRPWKLSKGLPLFMIDRHLKISELDDKTSQELKSNAVKVLSEKIDTPQPNLADFDTEVSLVKLGDIRLIPFILLQLICIWFDDLSIGKSKCETYSNTIEITLQRGLKKNNLPTLPTENATRNVTVPKCMTQNALCVRYMNLLLKLGKLAFNALFQNIKESSLVIEGTAVLNFLSEQEVKFCLKIGLLSQSKDSSKVSVERYKVFFQHKTIQEFMAALFITCEWKNEAMKSTILKVCSSLSSILEMENVYVFVCGMNPKVYTCISGELQKIVDHDRVTCRYRTYMRSDDERTMKSYQSMQVQCFQESVRNENYSCSIHLHDILVHNSLTEGDLTILKTIINFNNCHLKSMLLVSYPGDKITAFLQSLDTGVFTSLKTLKVEDCGIKPERLAEILTESARTLKCLKLSSGLYDIIITALTGLTCLQSLHLFGDHITTHSNLKCLYAYISQTTTLTHLQLDRIDCSDHGRKACVTLDIHRLNKLELVELRTLYMSSAAWQTLLSSVGSLPPPVTVKLFDCEGPSKQEWQTIVDVIKSNPKLSLHDVRFCWGFASLTLKHTTFFLFSEEC